MQKFIFPLPAPARIALLEPGFEKDRNSREFAIEDIGRLKAYLPEALALPLDAALWMADRKQRGLLDLPLTTAIVVLTSLADSPLAEHHRDLLWRAFGVPVFEQLRGWDGTVIARECEVHDGLHIDASAARLEIDHDELVVTQLTALASPIVRARTRLSGEMVSGPCDCGAETPRLRSLAPIHLKAAVAAAAVS